MAANVATARSQLAKALRVKQGRRDE